MMSANVEDALLLLYVNVAACLRTYRSVISTTNDGTA